VRPEAPPAHVKLTLLHLTRLELVAIDDVGMSAWSAHAPRYNNRAVPEKGR
jgi:hypothetical protein